MNGDTKSKTFAEPEDAYREFFRADSAKDAKAWAAVMSYPHVRVSANGTSPYYPTPEDYAARASWAGREATGWVRSVGVDPVRIHESSDKVHLAGGWTRYDAKDEPILRNRVTYTLTRLAGSWGIQARFGTDSFTEGERVDATVALGVVERHLQDMAVGNARAAADRCLLPLVEVGVGRVDRYATTGDAHSRLLASALPRTVEQIDPLQTGRDGVVVATRWIDAEGKQTSAVYLVARKEVGWRIAALSTMQS